jgi:hypothetical protein
MDEDVLYDSRSLDSSKKHCNTAISEFFFLRVFSESEIKQLKIRKNTVDTISLRKFVNCARYTVYGMLVLLFAIEKHIGAARIFTCSTRRSIE